VTELPPQARRRSATPRLAPLAGLAIPPLLFGACGAGSGVSASTAQQRLVAVADRVDACFGTRGDVRKCTAPDALGDLGDASLGDGPGDVALEASQPTRYQLTMKVDDRTSFAILVQPVGARRRVCAPAGAAGCPKGGTW
jgi:hypothetical protein